MKFPDPPDSKSPDVSREASGHLVDVRFAALMTHYQRAIYGYIMTLVGEPHDADDVLQEVNMVLWRKASEFDHDRPFLPWACTVAYYEVLAHRKRRQRERHVFLDDALLKEVVAEAQQAAEQFDARLDALRACLQKLPAKSRALLAQRYGIQRANIAADEHGDERSVGAIYTALHRIRRSLLDCIQRRTEAEWA